MKTKREGRVLNVKYFLSQMIREIFFLVLYSFFGFHSSIYFSNSVSSSGLQGDWSLS